MADDPKGGKPIALSPATFARHQAAVEYVEGMVTTRAPRPSDARFPGLAPGSWAILESGHTIDAATGTTLGTGTVKLCDRDGNVTDSNPLDVLNAGGEVGAPYGDRIVRLTWTGGDWAVTCPGGS